MSFGGLIRTMRGGAPARPVPRGSPPPLPRIAPINAGVTIEQAAQAFTTAGRVAARAEPGPITVAKPTLDALHVTKMVAAADKVPGVSRSGGSHEGYMHVSSLIGLCQREHCISQQHGLPFHTSATGAMKIIWAIGRAVEKHIRESVIQTRDYHGVYGVWTCPCEAAKYEGEYVRGRTCRVCHRTVNRYREPVIKNDFVMVAGSPDLTLVEMGYFCPVEIKSMNKEQFDKLEAPLADHVIQGACYRWLYEQAGYPVLDVVPVIYGRKDFKFGGTHAVYKEYHEPYSRWAGQVENAMMIGRAIAAHNEGGTLPPRICDSAGCSRAKSCARAALCFAL